MRANQGYWVNVCIGAIAGLIAVLLAIWVSVPPGYLALCALLGVLCIGVAAWFNRTETLRDGRVRRQLIQMAIFIVCFDLLDAYFLSADSVRTYGIAPASWGVDLAKEQGVAVFVFTAFLLLFFQGRKIFERRTPLE